MPLLGYLDGSGQPIVGASRNVIFGDAKQVQGPYTIPYTALIKVLLFYADVGGGGSGDVVPLFFGRSAGAPGALLGSGPAKTINPTAVGAGWFRCPYDPFTVVGGDYYFGTIAANVGATNFAEAYDAPGNPVGANHYHWNGDTYSDGSTNPFGTDNIIDQDASYYIEFSRLPESPSPKLQFAYDVIPKRRRIGLT